MTLTWADAQGDTWLLMAACTSDGRKGSRSPDDADLAALGWVRKDEAVAEYALTVNDPRAAHLHYDGCPYKPFAALPDWETPEDVPACTCAEEHKAAYWKGQFVLERGYKKLAEGESARMRSLVQYVEWAGGQCPRCGRTRDEGHNVVCDIAAALATPPARPPGRGTGESDGPPLIAQGSFTTTARPGTLPYNTDEERRHGQDAAPAPRVTREDRERIDAIRADLLRPGHIKCDSCRDSVAWLLALLAALPEAGR